MSILDLLKSLVKSNANIKVVERGNSFHELNDRFVVLWPNPEYLISKKLKNDFNNKPIFNDTIINEIHKIANQIVEIFTSLFNRKEHSDFENNMQNQSEMIFNIEEAISKLTIDVSNETNVHKITVDNWIERIKRIENNTSIVFQSDFNNSPILLTGDIGSAIMKNICEDKYNPSVKILDKYKVIKAPHHGTDNHFVKFDVYTKFDNIAISNGITKKNKERTYINKLYI